MGKEDELQDMLEDYLSPKELLYSLHSRIKIIEDRLEEIDEEIEKRKEIGERIMRNKQDKKSEYMSYLTKPHKIKKKVKGNDFDEQRASVQEKIDQLDHEINEEMESQWRDMQKLTEEKRDLKEKKEELKRRKMAASRALGKKG
jgi:chromosome segregation ATPase